MEGGVFIYLFLLLVNIKEHLVHKSIKMIMYLIYVRLMRKQMSVCFR